MYTDLLTKIGLSEAEAKAYQSLVLLGRSTPARIAEASGITRVNAYQILPRLESLGLAEQVVGSKKTEFRALSPEKLFDILNEEEQRLKQAKEEFRSVLQQMESKLRIIEERPVVQYLQGGREQIREMYREFLKDSNSKNHYGILHTGGSKEVVEWIESTFKELRLYEDFSLQLLIADPANSKHYLDSDEKDKRIVKYLELSGFPERTYIVIGEKKVLLGVYKYKGSEDIAILIDHIFITQAFKSMFDLLW